MSKQSFTGATVITPSCTSLLSLTAVITFTSLNIELCMQYRTFSDTLILVRCLACICTEEAKPKAYVMHHTDDTHQELFTTCSASQILITIKFECVFVRLLVFFLRRYSVVCTVHTCGMSSCKRRFHGALRTRM